jgi:hypothetical protein
LKTDEISRLIILAKRMPAEFFTKILHIDVTANEGFCAPSWVTTRVQYSVPSNPATLENFFLEQNNLFETQNFSNRDKIQAKLEQIFEFVLETGIWLENNLEFLPEIVMSRLLIFAQTPKSTYLFENPYFDTKFVKEKFSSIEQKIFFLLKKKLWKDDFGVSKNSRRRAQANSYPELRNSIGTSQCLKKI